MTTSYIGAYWGSREQPAAECARQLGVFLNRISALHPSLENWFLRGQSRQRANRPAPIDSEGVQALLEDGKNRRDIDGAVLSELGFRFGLWNGAVDSVELNGTIGSYPSTNLIGNAVVLSLPSIEVLPDLYRPPIADSLMMAFLEEWSPDWATWSSFEWASRLQVVGNQPLAGWRTYITSTRWRYGRNVEVIRGLRRGDLIRLKGAFNDVSVDELQQLQKLLR